MAQRIALEGVLQQAGDGHGADPSWHRGDVAAFGCTSFEIDIAHHAKPFGRSRAATH